MRTFRSTPNQAPNAPGQTIDAATKANTQAVKAILFRVGWHINATAINTRTTTRINPIADWSLKNRGRHLGNLQVSEAKVRRQVMTLQARSCEGNASKVIHSSNDHDSAAA
jgi:hypothetical protein